MRANNRKLELQNEEEEEIARILAVISQEVTAKAEEELSNVETLAILDDLFAKASWGVKNHACAANLMRPAIYGAYHHITVLGKEDEPCDHKYDVTGGLCENNDKFAIDRMLPKVEKGDLLCIHDTGAHGAAMGYNYNGKLHCAEVLLKADGSHQLIRRAQKPEDYFATLDCTEFADKLLKK